MHVRTLSMTAAAAAVMIVFAGAASADDPMAVTYDNTVVTKDMATGATSKLLFGKDMTYTAETTGKDGKPVSFTGTWALKDGEKTICLTPKAPPDAKAAPVVSCSPFERHKVGDDWQVTNDQKQTFEITITAGR